VLPKVTVNTRFFFTQLLGVSDKSFVLNFWFRRAVCQLFQRGDKPLWAKLCQLVVSVPLVSSAVIGQESL